MLRVLFPTRILTNCVEPADRGSMHDQLELVEAILRCAINPELGLGSRPPQPAATLVVVVNRWLVDCHELGFQLSN